LLNVMNVDKNIFGWTYSLIKYGDVYLRLYRESDYHDVLFNKVDMVEYKTNSVILGNLSKMFIARFIENSYLFNWLYIS
jgi:hypothetical protein